MHQVDTDVEQLPAGKLAQPTAELGHVRALDGIRALAVMAVLLFHGGLGVAPGGFLGVSVFFTLSGFLITSLLLRRWADGGADLGGFWSRRFRRLLPASWLTMGLVVVMAFLGVWDTEQLRSLPGDVAWSMAELLNWRFVLGGVTYGDSLTPPSPLQHFWSLAIEQQTYVLLPLLLVSMLALATRGASGPVGARRALGPFVVVVSLGLIASAVANGLIARGSVDHAYFGTGTRAAELLAGVLLACALLRRLRFGGGAARLAIGLAGLIGLAVLVLLFAVASLDDRWLYPWGLLATSVSTCAVVVATLQPGAFAAVLAWTPFVALGRISYGVYLLHWPIFLWLTPERTGWSSPTLFVPRVLITLAASVLMFRFLERPVLERTLLGRPAAARVAVAVAAVALLGGVVLATRDLPPPPDHLQPRAVDDVRVRPAATSTSTTTTSTTTTSPSPGPATTAPPPTPTTAPAVRARRVLFVGDSIAATLEDPLADALVARGISAASAIGPGCGIVTGLPARENGEIVDFTRPCDEAVPQRQRNAVAQTQPDVVLAVSSWESVDRVVDGVWHPYGTPEAEAVLRQLYFEALDRLAADGAVVLVATMPDYVQGELRTPNERELQQLRQMNALIERVVEDWPGRAAAVPFARMVCPSTPCPTEVDGIEPRPRDGIHFEDQGGPWAAERLADYISSLDLARI